MDDLAISSILKNAMFVFYVKDIDLKNLWKNAINCVMDIGNVLTFTFRVVKKKCA